LLYSINFLKNLEISGIEKQKKTTNQGNDRTKVPKVTWEK
jgi:hypothetical protein